MTFFEHIYKNTYVSVRYIFWYGDPVISKTWLYSGDALNYIITFSNEHELKF